MPQQTKLKNSVKVRLLLIPIASLLLGCGSGSATEEMVIPSSYLEPSCLLGCRGLKEWDELVSDSHLRTALALAYENLPSWREKAKVAARKNIRVVVNNDKMLIIRVCTQSEISRSYYKNP